MMAHIELAGATRRVDLSAGTSLAIPIGRDGAHPHFFTDQSVRFETLNAGSFTGCVRTGGSCNVETVTLIPHCHGTHTEGSGHITPGGESVQDRLDLGLLPAALVSIEPSFEHSETPVGAGPALTGAQLRWAEGARALIIRTLPNAVDKCRRDYATAPPYPLLTAEAMTAIVNGGIEHLLIDTPSIDAADDGGHLRQHRRFWGMQPGDQQPAAARAGCTITEMIYVPDDLADGIYLLSLGVSALRGDASPSAPIVFPVQ